MKKDSKPGKHTQTTKTSKTPSVVKEIDEQDRLIIDEYFNNFFNKSKAVLAIRTDLKHQAQGNHIFNRMIKKPEVNAYIRLKREEMQEQTGVDAMAVLKERLNWVSVDATDLIGINEQEIKNLPNATKRAIQGFKVTEREEVDRKGNKIKTTVIDCKLVDKNDSLKEIAKLIGAYEIHNKQKTPLNVDNINPGDRTKLIEIIKQLTSNKPKTINIS